MVENIFSKSWRKIGFMHTANGVYRKFFASLLLHGMILFCMACLWTRHSGSAIPVFQSGEFSLELAPSLPLTPVVAEPLPMPADNPLVEDIEEQPEEMEKPVEQPEEEEDSDILRLMADTQPKLAPRTPPPDVPAKPDNQPAAAPMSGAVNPGVPSAPRLESYIRPIYPPGARLRGEEGNVTVRATVADSGKAQTAEVVRSSGHPALDQAAINAVRRARFIPARQGRLAVESETTLTFRFTLVD